MQTAAAPMPEVDPSPPARAGNRAFWPALAVLVVLGAALYGCRLGAWPWDIDELSSLEEMGLLDPSVHEAARTPDSIVTRLPRLVPVWYVVQGLALKVLPRDELGTRLLPGACGVLTVVLLFVWGWRQRGPLFAAALAMLAGGSHLMLWLSQQNRFYSLAMLLAVAALAAIWSRAKGWPAAAATAALTLLAVLTHNVLVVLFGIGAVAACAAWAIGWAPGRVAFRAGLAGGLAALVYWFHVRPIAGAWTGVGFAWTNPLVSFVAHVGAPTLALALLGSALALLVPGQRRTMAAWAGMTVGVLAFVAVVPWIMPVWNARYALLFSLPLWVTGALAVELVARRLLGPADSSPLAAVCWFGCVALLLAPKLASHFLDGTRHDYRQAAAVAAELAQGGKGEPGLSSVPILTNMELQTRCYLPERLRPVCRYWPPDGPLPPGEFIAVLGSNIWQTPPGFEGRRADLVAQIGRRRYDELSHVVRVYRVHGDGAPHPASVIPNP